MLHCANVPAHLMHVLPIHKAGIVGCNNENK